MTILAILASVMALLAGASAVGAILVTRRYPPSGRFADAGGVRFHYVDPRPEAGGLPVVVVHGASGNGEEARVALDPLLSDRRAVYPDRPGHGHSSRGPAGMSAPAEQAAAIAALMDRLGIDRALLVGHSWGAAVAAAMAVTRPERVAGLVLLAPATHPWPGGVAWYHAVLRLPLVGALFAWTVPLPAGLIVMGPAVTEVFAPDPVPDGCVDRCRIPLVLRPWTFRWNSADIANLKANLAAMAPRHVEIRAPTVIVTGDRDTVVAPFIHAGALAREIEGAELVTIPDAGHMPHHAHPDRVAAAIRRVSETAAAQMPL